MKHSHIKYPCRNFKKHTVIHDNLHNEVIKEEIIEYVISVDSADRDFNVYPDPFSYVVKFNPSVDKIENKRDASGNLIRETIKGDPTPHVQREFENVRYIKL